MDDTATKQGWMNRQDAKDAKGEGTKGEGEGIADGGG